jgi:hypothetical protein
MSLHEIMSDKQRKIGKKREGFLFFRKCLETQIADNQRGKQNGQEKKKNDFSSSQ